MLEVFLRSLLRSADISIPPEFQSTVTRPVFTGAFARSAISVSAVFSFAASSSRCRLDPIDANGSPPAPFRGFADVSGVRNHLAGITAGNHPSNPDNDAADAEAICEAAQRPSMRFVAVKEIGQQDVQAIHRMRSLAAERRTAQVNQIRGLLLEYGIEIPVGRSNLLKRLPNVLEDAENGLTDLFREELLGLYRELRHLDWRIAHYDEKIKQIAQADERMQRLQTIPGIGPKIATVLVAAVGDIHAFKNGRELAVWLGLVPRQHSTGGKPTLLGISKRGDVYLRQLIIHGARSILLTVERKTDCTSQWAAAPGGARKDGPVRAAYRALPRRQGSDVGCR